MDGVVHDHDSQVLGACRRGATRRYFAMRSLRNFRQPPLASVAAVNSSVDLTNWAKIASPGRIARLTARLHRDRARP